jgi:hypothetical protein
MFSLFFREPPLNNQLNPPMTLHVTPMLVQLDSGVQPRGITLSRQNSINSQTDRSKAVPTGGLPSGSALRRTSTQFGSSLSQQQQQQQNASEGYWRNELHFPVPVAHHEKMVAFDVGPCGSDTVVLDRSAILEKDKDIFVSVRIVFYA